MGTLTRPSEQRGVTRTTQTDFQSEEEEVPTVASETTSGFEDVSSDSKEVVEDVTEEVRDLSEEEESEEEGIQDEDEDAATEISLEVHVRKIPRKEPLPVETRDESGESLKNGEEDSLENGEDDDRASSGGEEMEIHGKGLGDKIAENGTFLTETSEVKVKDNITERTTSGKDSCVKFVEGAPETKGPLMLLPSSIAHAQVHYERYSRSKTPTKTVGTDPWQRRGSTDSSGKVVNNMEEAYRISQPTNGRSQRQARHAPVQGNAPSPAYARPPGDYSVMSRRGVRSIPSPELDIKLHGGSYPDVSNHVTGSDEGDSDVDDDEAWLVASRKLTTTPASLPADPDMALDLVTPSNQRFPQRKSRSVPVAKSRHHADHHGLYRQALSIMSARCTSVARMRTVEGSAQAQSMDPTYYHYPDKYIYLEQNTQQPVPPIKVWRGYGGNLYFEPMECHTKPYTDPDERPTQRTDTDSPKSSSKSARLSTAMSTRTAKSTGSQTTSSSEHSTRSEGSKGRVQRTVPLACVKLDKTVVLNRNNSNLRHDIRSIAGIEAVGSLRISYQKPARKKSSTQERHKSARICKGFTTKTRNALNSMGRVVGTYPGLSVEGETASPKLSPRDHECNGHNTRTESGELIGRQTDTSMSYARGTKTPRGTPVTPELYGQNNDRLPPLELVQASVRRRRDRSPDVVIPTVRLRDGRASTASFETFSTVGNE